MIGKHKQSSDETCEWAALDALEALTTEEKSTYEKHLEEGCPVCVSEGRSFQAVVGTLALAATPIDPPAVLRKRLLDRIAQTPAEGDDRPAAGPSQAILLNQDGLLISRAPSMTWEKAPLPGLFVKTLYADREREYTTSLVRMEPGTTYPSHRHRDVEELYMLEGDLLVEGHRMRPGDYCRAEPDSLHGEVSTETGALFLVLSSRRNELIQ